MSTNAVSSSSTPTAQGDLDIDKILVREASAFQREVEVERILKAFKLKYAFRIYC
jgi:DnaJ family protein C protein 8